MTLEIIVIDVLDVALIVAATNVAITRQSRIR